MDELKAQLLKARLQGIISSIENEDSDNRSKHVSLSLAKDFNKILKEFCDSFPDHEDSFPEEIPSSFGRRLGLADATFLDLRIKAEQVVKIVEVLTAGG